MVEMTRKRIATVVGISVGVLGFILLLAGTIAVQSKWDDENVCNSGGPQSVCALFCSSGESWFEKDGCCYGFSSEKYKGSTYLILGAAVVGVIIATSLILECGDAICCECCQKCTACILGISNILGLAFVILLLVLLTAVVAAQDSGCDSMTAEGVFGQGGTIIAGVVFLALGCMVSVVLTFIECCCDDSKGNTGGGEVEAAVAP